MTAPRTRTPFIRFDLRRPVPTPTWVRWWKVAAVTEAGSWALLLIAMYFKYFAPSPTPVLVSIFGAIHGAVFVVFGILTLQLWQRLRWTWPTLILGALSTIPPFCSVLFEQWAARTGRLDEQAAAPID